MSPSASEEPVTPPEGRPPGNSPPQAGPRAPSLLDALLPVVVLIGLIALTIVMFGVDATGGPLQVALFMSAAFAALMAFKNGYQVAQVQEAVIGGISSAMGAIFILLAVGALIGTWNMAGTIPTLVSYGIRLLSADWFYLATAAVCAAVGMVTGSSWTTAGTLGVAFVGIAPVLGVSPEIAAGAVISGAYFGDKMSPLSETTILVPQLVGGVSTNEHIRAMLWTSGPAFIIALVIYAILGFVSPTTGELDKQAVLDVLNQVFNVSLLNLLPLLLLLIFSLRKVPPFLAILGSALFAGIMAPFTQPDVVKAVVGDESLGPVATAVQAIFDVMANGFVSTSGMPAVDELFSSGGMASLLTTVWLILGALAFAAVMESAGFLARLMDPLVHRARSDGALISSVVGTAIGLNVIAGDQYVADVLPSRAFRGEFAERGISPHVLSRAVEGSGTVTSVLVPWNSCGAYISGVLGVSTFAYFPYCFMNLLNPVIELIYGFAGIHIDRAAPVAGEPMVTGGPEAPLKV